MSARRRSIFSSQILRWGAVVCSIFATIQPAYADLISDLTAKGDFTVLTPSNPRYTNASTACKPVPLLVF